MTLIVKATGAADILATLPVLVGFTPRNSIVLLVFRGKRTFGAIRFDLPVATSKVVHKRVVSVCLGTLCKLAGVDAVIPVICTDDSFGDPSVIPHADFVELLVRRLSHSGFEVRDALCLATDGWASYDDPAVPASGHPLELIAESSAAARIPREWRRASDIQDLPARIPDAAPAVMQRVATELAEYRALYERLLETDEQDVAAVNDVRDADARTDAGELDAGEPDAGELDDGFDPLRRVSDLPLFAEQALSWDAATIDADGALLLFALQGPPARDMVMLQWATSLDIGDAIWDEPRESFVGGIDIGDLMMGIAPRPDPERLQRGMELLGVLISRASDIDRRPLLCMLAWSNWALGRASHAAVHIAEVRAIDPDYGMGQVLDTMLTNIPLPEWAFADPAAR